MTLRVLIADDELVARKRLVRLLSAMHDVEITAECSNGAEVLAALRDGAAVDVAILDIQMPELDGLEAGAMLGAQRPYLIYVTAHQQHAVAAFELGATDYVLKPVSADRLLKALERAKVARAAAMAEPGWRQRLAIHTSKGVELLRPDEISHAMLEGELVTVVADGKAFITERSLSELEKLLDPTRFRRVHRRVLINMDHLRRLVPQDSGGYQAQLTDGSVVPVSRQAARLLRQEMGL